MFEIPMGSVGFSYAGSASGVRCVDWQEDMQDRFTGTLDPIPLDRSLAVQAQTFSQSGLLNANHRKLLELQQTVQSRLKKSRARLAEGLQDAREAGRDLEYIQKRVSNLKSKASCKHPKEYKLAQNRYLSPEYHLRGP